MTTSAPQPLSLAIVGGGIAGLCTVIALRNHCPHLDLALYESAHHFGEIGAGVAIGPNAARAMTLIDPAVKAGFDKISTTNQWASKRDVWFEFRWGMEMEVLGKEGREMSKTGELVDLLKCPEGQATVHRARFLDEMVKLVPEGIAKFGKRVESVQEVEGGSKVRLRFKDGSEAVHDAVVGCDGIKSRVRDFVAPECKAAFTQKYCHRGLVPMDKAIEAIGEELAMNNTVYLGRHGHAITFPVDHGETMNVVLYSGQKTWDSDEWVVHTSKEHMFKDFEGWGSLIQNIISLMQNSDIWTLFDHFEHPAPSYNRNNVLILGDAAHASTPHQGSGAGMAIEDAYVLSQLLAGVQSCDGMKQAFKAFDKVRRERTQKLVTTSREAGLFWEFDDPEYGDDVGKMKENIQTRMDWVWNVDFDEEIRTGRAIID